MKTFLRVAMEANDSTIEDLERSTKISFEKLMAIADGGDVLTAPEAVLLSLFIGCQPEECHQDFELVERRLMESHSRGENQDPWGGL